MSSPISPLDPKEIKYILRNYLKNNSDFNSYDYEGSNIAVLLDLLAYNAHLQSYNINMVANELSLDTAVIRDNVVALANRLGYNPKSYTAACMRVTLRVDNVTGDYVQLDAGPVLSSVLNNKTYKFNLLETKRANITDNTAIFTNLELYEGNLFDTTYIADLKDENQRFVIPNSLVDSSKLSVKVNGISHTRTENIIDLTPSSKVFFVEEIQDQKYEIIFGDDILGRAVKNGEQVDIRYLITNGSKANNIKNFIFVGALASIYNTKPTVVSAKSVQVTPLVTSSFNGSEFESIKSIKYNAPRYYSSQDRAVTASDYQSIVRSIYPNIKSIKVVGGENLSPPQYGKVFITIQPKFGDVLSSAVKDLISKKLRNYIVGAVFPVILDPFVIKICVYIKVLYKPTQTNLSESDLANSVKQIVSSFGSSDDTTGFGSKYSQSILRKNILNSESSISTSITKPVLKHSLKGTVGSRKYKVCFGTPIGNSSVTTTPSSPGKCDLLSLTSTEFNATGRAYKVHITDNANGLLILRRYDSTFKKYVILGVIGNVDYKTGCLEFTLDLPSEQTINITVVPSEGEFIDFPSDTLIDVDVCGLEIIPEDEYDGDDETPLDYPTDEIGDDESPLDEQLISTYCQGFDEYGTYTNSTGGTYTKLIKQNSATCGYGGETTYPDAGTLLNEYCKGFNKWGVYADGKGGTYDKVIELNSKDCGYLDSTNPIVVIQDLDPGLPLDNC